jgi:hypothetical protein
LIEVVVVFVVERIRLELHLYVAVGGQPKMKSICLYEIYEMLTILEILKILVLTPNVI